MGIFNTDTQYKTPLSERVLTLIGLDRETAPALLIIAGSMLLIALVIISTKGDVIAVFAPLAILALVILTFYRVDYSFFALVAFVLLFDQFYIPGFKPLTFQIDYFRNLKEISYLPSFDAGVMNPIEIHLLLILFVWFAILSIQKRIRLNGITVWGAFVLFTGWLIFSFAYGLKNNGNFLTGLWEVRAFVYFALFYMVIPQIIQTSRQLKILVWIFIIVISIKAFQGIVRFALMGFSFRGLPALTNHEDPVFISTLLILLLGFWFFRVKGAQKIALSLLFLPLAVGFFTGQRRAAIAALVVSLATFFILLPVQKQWRFIKMAIPVLVALVVYGAVFWNSDSKIARPVQLVKSGLSTSQEQLSKDDYYSNIYRVYENYNLAYTTQKHPVIGTGFGKKYEQPFDLANINFTLRDYIPHNQILWVIVKTGIIGFFCFWLFFYSFAFQGAFVLSNLDSPYLKAVCMMIVVAIINQMVVSYFDLQLTYYRNMIYLGCLMGLLPVLWELDTGRLKKLQPTQK